MSRNFGFKIPGCYGDFYAFITHSSQLHSFLCPHFWARCLTLVTYRYWLSVLCIKGRVIKWPVKLYVRFFTFFTFFQNPKNMNFYVFLSCCTRFVKHWTIRISAIRLLYVGLSVPCLQLSPKHHSFSQMKVSDVSERAVLRSKVHISRNRTT